MTGRYALLQNPRMTEQEIDHYLAGLEEPKQSTLRAMRAAILRIVPAAEQGIAYGMPAFRLDGKVIAGFAAFKDHLSYLPHSGSVLPALADDLHDYSMTKGALHFRIDKPVPARLLKKLIAVRQQELQARQRRT